MVAAASSAAAAPHPLSQQNKHTLNPQLSAAAAVSAAFQPQAAVVTAAAPSAHGSSLFTFTRPRSYSSSSASSMGATQLASLSLVDHLDMARPAHEEPGRGATIVTTAGHQRSILVQHKAQPVVTQMQHHSPSNGQSRNSAISLPITIAPSAVSWNM